MIQTPDEPPSAEEVAVIVWAAIGICVVVSALVFYYSLQAPANKPELAIELREIGFGLLAFAAIVYGIKRAIEFYLD